MEVCRLNYLCVDPASATLSMWHKVALGVPSVQTGFGIDHASEGAMNETVSKLFPCRKTYDSDRSSTQSFAMKT